MSASEVYSGALEYAQEFDPEFGELLAYDRAYAESILAIGRGGKKPRKDIATWKEVRHYMSFFYDELFAREDSYPEKFASAVVLSALEQFSESYDPQDDSTVWFDKVKAITERLGFTTDMKAYKQNPDAFPGTVADVSGFLRIAVTGRVNSPDLYTVMGILGKNRTLARIHSAMEALH